MKANKKVCSFVLTISLILTMFPSTVFAVDGADTVSREVFSDIRNDWSAAPLNAAVSNGLLKGYGGRIMPKDPVTRAQLAVMINRVFGSEKEDSLEGYTDVSEKDWYFSDMAKAVHMKTFNGSGSELQPKRNISREEVFAVIARAFKLPPADFGILDQYSDKDIISSWAKAGTASLSAAGYIKGADGKLNPKKDISRAEIAQLLDNLVKQYITSAGTYSFEQNGNVMVNVPGVVLKDMKITGDLIIGDGVGDGDVTLDSVTVTGKLLIRGGGVNSVKIIGNSSIRTIIVARVDGQVRVYGEDGAEIGEIVADGSDDVILEGIEGSVIIAASNITMTLSRSSVPNCAIQGEKVRLIVEENSSAKTVLVNGKDASVAGDGDVGRIDANADNLSVSTKGTRITVAEGVKGITVNGKPFSGESAITGGHRGHSNSEKEDPVAVFQAARAISLEALYNSIAKNPDDAEEMIESAKALAGDVGDMSSAKAQAARAESLGVLYSVIAQHPEVADILTRAAIELVGVAGDLSSTEVQAARAKSFRSLYEAIGEHPEAAPILTRAAINLVGEAGDLSSAEVQAARAESFAGLYKAIAESPDAAGFLTQAAIRLVGEAGDLSSVEVQAARAESFANLYYGLASIPERADLLTKAAIGLVGPAGHMSSAEIQSARARGFSSLYQAIARRPDYSDLYVQAALDLVGPVGDMSSAAVQAARADSFGSLYEAIARQPEEADLLIEAAITLVGPAGDMTSAEVQAARASGLASLYASIARQPEAAGLLTQAAITLVGPAGDMSSATVQAARASSFASLYDGIARQPEAADLLTQAAIDLVGPAGDMSSAEVQAARAAGFSSLYTSIARQPEAAGLLTRAAISLVGLAGDMSSPAVQAARAKSFNNLYTGIARNASVADQLVLTAILLTGEFEDLSSAEAQAGRAFGFSGLYDGIGRSPEAADLLTQAAIRLVGEAGDMTPPEVQTARVESFSSIYSQLFNPTIWEMMVQAAERLTGNFIEW